MTVFIVSCQTSQSPLIVGDEVDVKTETIETGGGTITVDTPGEPLDGLTLEVPEGSYEEEKTFLISYRPVLEHTLGNKFNPLTPLIRVENGGGYAQEIMTVTIPINIPDDQFAMAFFYDESSGELEGIPLIDETANSLTFATSHFSDFIVSAVAKGLLELVLDSGFKYGTDDWQFANYGSYVAPQGHCSGQSITALYYYFEKKLKEGKPALYGLYDNDGNPDHKTPEFQWDDELAYKLCSVAQVQSKQIIKKDKYIQKKQKLQPIYTYWLFAYSLLLQKPSYVAIYHTKKMEERSGHAMIVYKKSEQMKSNGKNVCVFYVSDPNYPFKPSENKPEREIVFNVDNGTFESYFSGPDALNLGKEYNEIYYIGKTAFVDFSKLDTLWQKFEEKTIGAVEFPDYEIRVVDDAMEYSLVESHTTDSRQIDVKLCGDPFELDPRLRLYDSTGNLLDTYNLENQMDECVTATLDKDKLSLGDNLFGFLAESEAINEIIDEGKKDYEYLGFDWITIKIEESKWPYNKVNFLIQVLVDFKKSDGTTFQQNLSCGGDLQYPGKFKGNTFISTWDGVFDYGGLGVPPHRKGSLKVAINPDTLELTDFEANETVTYYYSDGAAAARHTSEFSGYNLGLSIDYYSQGSQMHYEAHEAEACKYINSVSGKIKKIYPDTGDNETSEATGDFKCDNFSDFQILLLYKP